jgi:hypothetical protein
MKARVKADSRFGVVMAFTGREYTKREWRDVPPGYEAEAGRHPYLELEEAAESTPEETKPAEPAASSKPAARRRKGEL